MQTSGENSANSVTRHELQSGGKKKGKGVRKYLNILRMGKDILFQGFLLRAFTLHQADPLA